LTPKLIVVMSIDTVDLVYFLLFFASAVWIATMVVVAREVDIFPAICRVCRGVATMDGTLRNMAGASSSLPIVELEIYSSTGGVGATCTSATSRTL
jgi:hypothetical protein